MATSHPPGALLATMLVSVMSLAPPATGAGELTMRDLVLPRIGGGGGDGSLRPEALASADLDGDGVADLVVALAGERIGAVSVYPGNIDAVFPNSPQARARRAQGEPSASPFRDPSTVPLSIRPDFIGTGDLDNDGHWDAVAAARGGTELHFLRGDGGGRLVHAGTVRLPGRITAMTSGEVNRIDGIADLVVAVAHDHGARLMVFESPRGALRGAAEIHELRAPASEVAIGFLGSPNPSIVAAVGSELVVVHGRDRCLSLGAERRAAAPAARVDSIRLPQPARAVASAWLAGTAWQDVVVLLADGGVAAIDGSVLEDLATGRRDAPAVEETIRIFVGPGSSIGERARLVTAHCSGAHETDLFIVDPDNESVALVELSTATALKTVQRFERAFAPSAVALRLAPSAMRSILIPRTDRPGTLAELVLPVRGTFVVNDNNDAADHTLDGVCETAPGNGVCSLRAAIQEANTDPGFHMITFAGLPAGDHTIYPLAALPNLDRPMIIDGTTHPDGMVEVDGTAAGLVDGLSVFGGSTTLRGLAIHSFGDDGISLDSGYNVVEGCHLGVDFAGAMAQGNTDNGVRIVGDHNQVGGAAAPARNVISGNEDGVFMDYGSGFNVVQGNYIGTDASGTLDLGNSYSGVLTRYRYDGIGSLIGGSAPGEGNLLSGNGYGVLILEVYGSQVFGNLIGTDVTGGEDLGNAGPGIKLNEAMDTAVGSTAVLARNVISGNVSGIQFEGYDPVPAAVNVIQNNLIGTDASGMGSLGNSSSGVKLASWNSGNVVGGSVAEAANVVSANGGHAIQITSSNGNSILGNLIGTDETGLLPLGNAGAGVFVDGVSSTAVGGGADGEANVIAFNVGDAVTIIGGGLFNKVSRNWMASNGGLGIDLGNDGVTANDAGDGDSGTNRLMNYPEIVCVGVNSADEVEVIYRVDCDPLNADYDLRVELYHLDSADPAAAWRFLGYDVWTVDDEAIGMKGVVLGGAAVLGVSVGDWMVATSTDADGNTSELGAPTQVTDVCATIFEDGFESGTTDAWDVTVG